MRPAFSAYVTEIPMRPAPAGTDDEMKCYCCGFCIYILLIAASIVMIIMSESIKQGYRT